MNNYKSSNKRKSVSLVIIILQTLFDNRFISKSHNKRIVNLKKQLPFSSEATELILN
jgi:hypothetical protein